MGEPNPSGMCLCGCGGRAPTARRTGDGYRKGQAKRFIYGHHRWPIQDRFWSQVTKGSADECWEWQGALNDSGYGRFRRGASSRDLRAHRVSWGLANGPIPPGMCVLHRCDNRKCVNPGHLFLGTRTDNAADRDGKGRTWNGGVERTHCKHGHPFAGENLWVDPKGHRHCRTCMRERSRQRRLKLKSASAAA